MHEKDNIIPASKGDGTLHLMFSVWNEMKNKCWNSFYALLCLFEFLNHHKSHYLCFADIWLPTKTFYDGVVTVWIIM